MKNQVVKIAMFCLVSAATLNTACSDDSDTTKPVITVNQPTEGAVIMIGDANGITLDVNFEDNEELASYSVDIHNNFGEGHDHGHSRARAEEVEKAFSFKKSWSLSGKTSHVNHTEIKVPAGVSAGKYHLIVFCTDKNGNDTFVARNIILSDGSDEYDHDHE